MKTTKFSTTVLYIPCQQKVKCQHKCIQWISILWRYTTDVCIDVAHFVMKLCLLLTSILVYTTLNYEKQNYFMFIYAITLETNEHCLQ